MLNGDGEVRTWELLWGTEGRYNHTPGQRGLLRNSRSRSEGEGNVDREERCREVTVQHGRHIKQKTKSCGLGPMFVWGRHEKY